MKIQLMQFLAIPLALILGSCEAIDEGYGEATGPAGGSSYGQALRAVNGQSVVTILEGSRTVATCYTASPFIEETRFINEQNQIVVKSRGSHGPATVQLFSTSTGREESRVMAYDIRGDSPGWAAGMGE